ncbi:hypothetical protein [Geodermatophilus sp. URMC 64]
MDGTTAQQRFVRALMGVVAASALVYPMLFCAVQLVFAQLFTVDVVAVVVWLSVAMVCSVGLVAALRWGAARRIRSYWLLLGLAPPAVYELWLFWPAITA